MPGTIGQFTMKAWSTGATATSGFPILHSMTPPSGDFSDTATIAALIEKLRDGDSSGMEEVAEALAAIGPIAVPALIDALGQDEWPLRRGAAVALWKMGPAAKDAVPALRDALGSTDWAIQEMAACALGEIGPAAKDAVPALIKAIRRGREAVRYWAGQALRGIGTEAMPALMATFGDWTCDAEVIDAALVAMGSHAVTDLLDILRRDDPDPEPRRRAAKMLERIGSEAVPGLVAVWKDETDVIRNEAAKILVQINPDLIVGIPLKNEPPGEDDERLLRWFDEFNLKDYQTDLQVFWCVGYVDREALQSAGTALGLKRLSQRLSEIDPHFKRKRLPRSIGYLRETCFESIYGLFDKEPFRSEAWSPEERTLEIRPGVKYKERDESRWTPKAWKAWQYVDRFLRMRKLLPTIISENSD